MEWLLFYFIFAAAVGFIASRRGRSGFGWFLLAVFISPLISVIVLALIPSRAITPSLGEQVRDRMIETRFSKVIRKHKPAFSNYLVYDVEWGGKRHRFKTKADAVAFCVSNLPPDDPLRQSLGV